MIKMLEDELNSKVMVLFIGIQACGKTTFYNTYFKEHYEHVSLDVLHTRNKERLAIEECIRTGRKFVVDNTNPTRADRERYITIAKEHGYKIVGYYFKSSIKECVNRNERRSGKAKVPACAIAATSNKLELPECEEGFEQLYYVQIIENEMIVEEWKEDEI